MVSKYKRSRWADLLPWENWRHAALVSKLNPLTIIEAAGKNSIGQSEGPAEVAFKESVGFGRAHDIRGISWLRPVFPNPLREIDSWRVPRSKRRIITEEEARKRVVKYAQEQIGEPYTLAATKWRESAWYCSSLIYKSYSRAITGMYIEDYSGVGAGFFVTPGDLLESKRTDEYFMWKK